MIQPRSYILCTSPRSGSTLLCRLLEATGSAGNPDSHFHRPSLASWLSGHGLKSEDYRSEQEKLAAVFNVVIARYSGKNGLFGLRLQQQSFSFFMQKLEVLYPEQTDDLARLQAAFGPLQFFFLTREDKLGQAISRLRAEQSGLWHRNADGSELERLSAPRALNYDAAAIARYVEQLIQAEQAWEGWFSEQGIAPLRITYETLSDNPAAVLANILRKLGQDPSVAQSISPPTAKLSDEISREWASRFKAERSAHRQK